MNRSRIALIAAAAMTGLLSGCSSTSHQGTQNQAGAMAPHNVPNPHACAGQNSCKGQGGCKSGDNGCVGKNSCKGKGGCNTLGT